MRSLTSRLFPDHSRVLSGHLYEHPTSRTIEEVCALFAKFILRSTRMNIARNHRSLRNSVAKYLSALALLLAVGLVAVPARGQGGSGTYHVIYQDPFSGDMVQLYNPGTGWQPQDITSSSHGQPPIAANVSPAIHPSSSEYSAIVDTVADPRSEHIYYTGANFDLNSEYWHPSTGAWSSVDLTQQTGAPQPGVFTQFQDFISSLSPLLDTIIDKGSKHIYYQGGAAQHLISLYWHPANGGSWTWVDLSTTAGLTTAPVPETQSPFTSF